MKSRKLDQSTHDLGFLNMVQKLKSTNMHTDQAEMNLSCARLARKQRNLGFASRLMASQFDKLKFNDFSYNDKSTLFELFQQFETDINQTNAIISEQMKLNIIDCEREACKLLNSIETSTGSPLDSIQSLAECVFRFTDELNSPNPDETTREKHARSLLTIAKWVHMAQSNQYIWSATSINKLISKSFSSIPPEKLNLKPGSSDPNQVGDILDLSTVVAPKLGKSWYQLADWSFRRTRNLNVNLNDLIPLFAADAEREFITSLFSSSFPVGGEREPDCSPNDDSETQLREDIKTLLEEKCSSFGPDCIETITDAYLSHARNLSNLNTVACNSYFTFLQLGDKVKKRSNDEEF